MQRTEWAKSRGIVLIHLAAVWLVLANLPLGAASLYTWTGGTSASWVNNANWSTANFDATCSTALNCNVAIGLAGDPTAAHATTMINGVGTLSTIEIGTLSLIGSTFSANVASSNTLIIGGSGTSTNSGTLVAGTGGTLSIVNGTLNNTGGTLSGVGSVNIGSTATVRGGTLTNSIVNNGTLNAVKINGTVSGSGTISGITSINGGSVASQTVVGTLTAITAGTFSGGNVSSTGLLQSGAGSLWITGAIANQGTISSSGSQLTISGATINNTGGLIAQNLAPLYVVGSTVTGGQLGGSVTSTGSSFSGVTVNSGGSLASSGSFTTLWAGGTNSGSLAAQTATLSLSGVINNTNGQIQNEGPGNLVSKATVLGGTIDVQFHGSYQNFIGANGGVLQATAAGLTILGTGSGTIYQDSVGSILATGGSVSLLGNLIVNGGTIAGSAGNMVNAAGGATINTVNFSNLNLTTGYVANSKLLGNNTLDSVAFFGTNNIAGNTNTISNSDISGSILNVNGGSTRLTSLTDGNGSQVNFTGGESTLSGTFTNSGGTPGVYSLGNAILNIGNATFDGQAINQLGGTLNITDPVDPLGAYVLTNGTLNLNSTFTVGTATLSGGTVSDGGGQIVADNLFSNVNLNQSEIGSGSSVASSQLATLTLSAGSTLNIAPPAAGGSTDSEGDIQNVNEVYVQNGGLTLGGTLNITTLTLTDIYPQLGLSPEPYLFPIFQTGPAGVSGMFSQVCDSSSTCYGLTDQGAGIWQIGSFSFWDILVRPLQNSGNLNGNIEVVLADTPGSTATPEPATYLTIGGAILGLGLLRRRRHSK